MTTHVIHSRFARGILATLSVCLACILQSDLAVAQCAANQDYYPALDCVVDNDSATTNIGYDGAGNVINRSGSSYARVLCPVPHIGGQDDFDITVLSLTWFLGIPNNDEEDNNQCRGISRGFTTSFANLVTTGWVADTGYGLTRELDLEILTNTVASTVLLQCDLADSVPVTTGTAFSQLRGYCVSEF